MALAPISDPTLVPATIAQAVGVRDAGRLAPLESLKTYLRDRQGLLLLDDFEHVLSAGIEVAELLTACARLQVLVTSRAALRMHGEHELAVAPLELPRPALDASMCESVRLFVERARAVKGDFALTDETAPAVAEISLRLDGLPLAIELAPARSRLLPAQAMLARLEHRLQFLTGARDLPVRQQTLRNTIAWRYDLLDCREKALFRTVAVFVGGCTLEAAQVVLADVSAGSEQAEVDLIEAADLLAARSLPATDLRRLGPAATGHVRDHSAVWARTVGEQRRSWNGSPAATLTSSWRWPSAPNPSSGGLRPASGWNGWRPSATTSAPRSTGA